MAVFRQLAVRPAGRQKATLYLDVLRGAAGPDVLKGSGARVRLVVAHYSDKYHVDTVFDHFTAMLVSLLVVIQCKL